MKEVVLQGALMPIEQMKAWADAAVKSKLWSGFQNADQMVGLMLLCQSEGLHPMTAVRQYDLIQGKPAMKSEAQLAKFYARGGKVTWIKRDNTECRAKFFSPSCPEGVEVAWTMEDARKAGLEGKDNWKKFPRQMLSARVQAEGVQIADPGAALGILNVEEAIDVGSILEDQTAALAQSLTGQEEVQGTTAATPAEREDKEWRRMRAELNQGLLKISTVKDFRQCCQDFQNKYGGRGIWMALTRHNDMETFGSLAQQHQQRVEGEEQRRSPEAIKKWLADLSDCTSNNFQHFQAAFNSNDFLRDNQEVADAIAKRGRELGIEEYAEDNEIHKLSDGE